MGKIRIFIGLLYLFFVVVFLVLHEEKFYKPFGAGA